MEIINVTPRGYCRGVTRAIQMAKQAALDYPTHGIYVLGMLVHNAYVIQALAHYGIKTIDDKKKNRMDLLQAIPDGSVVIFTAHGISQEVVEEAQKRGLLCIDASCPDVLKTQQVVHTALSKEDVDVLYIGKQGHPEAEAVLSISNRIHLITCMADVDRLPDLQRVFVTNQTTMSIFDIETIFAYIRAVYPNATFSEEICNATRIRQEAVAKLQNQNIDVLYVVGDTSSNNSTRLAQIAHEQDIPQVYLIDDVGGIEEAQLQQARRVAVTAGASTPTYLTNQVIQYLKNYETGGTKGIVEIDKII